MRFILKREFLKFSTLGRLTPTDGKKYIVKCRNLKVYFNKFEKVICLVVKFLELSFVIKFKIEFAKTGKN